MPGEPLTREAVENVARLSKLALDAARVERYRQTLSAVLGYAERLGKLDLEAIEPLTSPLDATSRLRDDEPGPMLDTSQVMSLAPDRDEPFIKVPKVLGEGRGA